MKLAANLSFLFNDLAFPDRFPAAAGAGFKGVEFLFPYGYPAEEIRKWLDQSAMIQVLFNAPPGDWNNGERGIAALPGREEEFEQSFHLALSYAEKLGCRRIHVMAGIVPDGYAAHDCYAVLARNLRWASALAAKSRLTILLEPLNPGDMPGYLYSRTNEVVGLIDRMGLDNIKLQLDLYHRQLVEGEPAKALLEYRDHIGHIQIAGVPARNEPDQGELDLPALISLLDEVGYSGWIGCEYHPAGETVTGLAWAREWLGR